MCEPSNRCYKGRLLGGPHDGGVVDVPANCIAVVKDELRYELEDGWPGPTALPTYRFEGEPYSSRDRYLKWCDSQEVSGDAAAVQR